jgi:alpha-aminoadipate carrier protein LysW
LEVKAVPTASCPECSEKVYVDADSEQGDLVTCDECGSDLEVVGLDPFELDLYEDKGEKDDYDEEDFDSYDYEDDRY